MATFDATKLVAQITIKGTLPVGRFEEQELLDFASDSLLSEIVPAVLEAREDFYVTWLDIPVVANQASYDIPSRALNGVLREAKLVRGSRIVDLERMDLEDAETSTPGKPDSFFMLGNSVVLYPTPDVAGDTLRLYFFMRPSRIVTNSECARISAIDALTRTVDVTIPTGWTSSNTFDIVRGRAYYDILDYDLVASSVSGGQITFTTALPSNLQVGDYVTLAEETCFPQLPPEGHVALAQAAAATALESIGDPNAATCASKAKALRDSFVSVLKTRVVGAPKALGKRLL